MAISISSFVNSRSAKYTAANVNQKQQRLLRILAKAAVVQDVINPGIDFVTTDAAAKSLITTAATVTKGMTPDQVLAAKVDVYAVPATTSFTTLTAALARVKFWSQLDDATLDRMELVVDYYLSSQS